MPELDRFEGIIIRMYFEIGIEHHSPHIHAEYNEYSATFDFNGKLLAGKIPLKEAKKIREWISKHQEELSKTWVQLNGFVKGCDENEN